MKLVEFLRAPERPLIDLGLSNESFAIWKTHLNETLNLASQITLTS